MPSYTPEDLAKRNEEEQAKALEAEKQKLFRRLVAYRAFFDSSPGQEVLRCLRESVDGNTHRSDPYESAYQAGRRSVFLDIIEAVEQARDVLSMIAPERSVADLQPRAELPGSIEEL